MTEQDFQIPPLTAHWFHAIDAPIKDPIAIRTAKREKSITSITKKPTPTPKNWVPFSKRDTIALETAYQSNLTTVAVNEDYLFEVNVSKREIYPIYWEGPTFHVRRATWFMQSDGPTKWIPCEENMATQIEKGYLNHQPYIESLMKEETTDVDLGDKVSIKVEEKDAQSVNLTIESSIKEEEKEILTEPYAGQYIVYTSQTKAWLLYDTTSAKITKSFLTKLTNNQNLGGTRLIRGYKEVKKETEKKKPTTPPPATTTTTKQDERVSMESMDLTQPHQTREPHSREAEITEHQENDYDNEESEEVNREINQLVFVIHGIGQQMTERLTGQNLVHDVNVLRKTIKSTWPVAMSGSSSTNGIQVLPILWRKGILVGSESTDDEKDQFESDIGISNNDDGCPTLDEITLEGAPNIRNIVADVFLDIPLYMTSKHHETMIKIVTKEINRVYKLFIERNPHFLKKNGQVTLFAHSLGSLLAFDILTAQPFPGVPDPKKPIALDFPVKNYFAIGSPLGMLLLLRGEKVVSRKNLDKPIDSNNDDVTFVYPKVDNMYNIFHKSDPVAYRLEPLVVRHYGAQLKPMPIPYIKGGLKSMLDAGFNVGNDIANRASNMFESFKTGLTSTLLMRGLGFSKPLDATVSSYEIKTRSATDPNLMAARVAAKSAAKLKLLNPSGRLDYYIQEGLLENTYISALSVHMSYWQDVDVAGFLVRELYKNQETDAV